jgi:hypothetical protein
MYEDMFLLTAAWNFIQIFVYSLLIYIGLLSVIVNHGKSVGTETGYGLDGQGSESDSR